jgi:hypothetical protein
MDPKHSEFLALVGDFEKKKEAFKEAAERLDAVMAEVGVGTYIQCLNTLSVYKIVKPSGTFISYKDIGFIRTAREGERGGTVLSKKEAEEAGFVLKK